MDINIDIEKSYDPRYLDLLKDTLKDVKFSSNFVPRLELHIMISHEIIRKKKNPKKFCSFRVVYQGNLTTL